MFGDYHPEQLTTDSPKTVASGVTWAPPHFAGITIPNSQGLRNFNALNPRDPLRLAIARARHIVLSNPG